MSVLKIFLLLFFAVSTYASPLIIDGKTDYYNLLPYSEIYIDKSKSLLLEDIEKKDSEFNRNNKKQLSFGYSPDFNVWVRFTLKNNSNKTIEKILEYKNVLTTDIKFYDLSAGYSFIQDGLLNLNAKRKTVNPMFEIRLEPNESKTYFIQTSSYITTLIVKLNLWDKNKFYETDTTYQFYLALFFGAMSIMAIYNLFIFFFTKDISYLFYVLYIIGIIAHQLIYVGIGSIYVFNQYWVNTIIQYASLLVAFPIFALGLFTKTFLRTKQYPIFNKILNMYLILLPLSVIIFSTTDAFNKYRNIFSLLLILYLMILSIYATYKRNRQAYFILFGWVIIASAFSAMYFSSTGLFNIYKYLPYIVEISFVLEAIVFSIALADKINQLQKDKQEANQKLIVQQQNEKQRLKKQVTEKTKDLEVALDEKGLLLKELNHRVKNNMQTIISLIRLQSNEIEDEGLQSIFQTAQNRISAMSHLHELLYKQDNISHIDAHEYFKLLINEIQGSYDSNISINFNIQTQLKMEQAIYCGLILNELISNSYKYAFPIGKGKIDIALSKIESVFHLSIADNGIGYDKETPSNSLGLTLVNILAKQQLRGNIQIHSSNGVQVTIQWSSND